MKTRLVQLGFLSLALLVARPALCQTEIIVREKPLESRALAGAVQLGDSPEGVKGVLVEWCSPDWKTVKTSTRTDEKGRFSFSKASKKELHYLRFSFPGAHTLQIKVKMTGSGPKELTVRLEFAT